ncbi:pyridoxal phosphate-dependent decarboxylase family protein [Tateyamaria sp.]
MVAADVRALSTALDAPDFFAHMDPAPSKIAAKLVGLNAQYNQNLLHPDLSPFATKAERRVIDWLAPIFGMSDGHMCCGSSVANLTGIWCARESGATRVVASADAHLSVAKAAHILGMDFDAIAVDQDGKLDPSELKDLSDSCLVLTAGTTARGAVDPMVQTIAVWTHVDAAWAGPLRLTKFRDVVSGIETADSIAISAHKWLYQPKDSALIFFRDPQASKLISFGGEYLTVPNVGVQGSRSAAAIPLLGTLLAWGKQGLAQRVENSMKDSETLAHFLKEHPETNLCGWPQTGVVNWRPKISPILDVVQRLGNCASITNISGDVWIRQVAANSYVDIDEVIREIEKALQ